MIPCFNEAESIQLLCKTLIGIDWPDSINWEVILVDDGSFDETWKIISTLIKDRRFKGIRLSRNVGQEVAILAGIRKSLGRAVITMDADLQHPPDLIPQMIERWQKGDLIVATRRIYNEGTPFPIRILSKTFYKLFSLLSGIKLDDGSSDFRLLDRSIIDEIVRLPVHSLFLRGFVEWLSPGTTAIDYVAPPRQLGTSHYEFSRRLSLSLKGITSFSIMPLRFAMVLGTLLSTGSFIYQIYIFIVVISGKSLPGWASITGLISLLIGALFLYLGVLGEYLGRVYQSLRDFPPFFISDRTLNIRARTEEEL